MTVYPYFVRSLAVDVDTTVFARRKKRATWPLSVAGPFCYGRRSRADYRRSHQELANLISAHLGLPVHERWEGNAIHLDVVIDLDTKDRLIQAEYGRQTVGAR